MSFISKSSKKKVAFKSEISPKLNERIELLRLELQEINPDLEYKPEDEIEAFLEKHVAKAEKDLAKIKAGKNKDDANLS